MRFRAWGPRYWELNAGPPDSQLLLAWVRRGRAVVPRGALARMVGTPYWWIPSLVLGVELPASATIGPNRRPRGIAVDQNCALRSHFGNPGGRT